MTTTPTPTPDLPVREQVLRTAGRAILKERNTEYGEPADNLGTIASLWSTYLGTPLRAEQVAACMALVKIARLKHSAGFDSWVDLAGYAGIGAEVDDRG